MHDGVSKILSLKVNDASPTSTILSIAENATAAVAVSSLEETASIAEETPETEEEMPLDPDFAPASTREEPDEGAEHARKYDATQDDEE